MCGVTGDSPNLDQVFIAEIPIKKAVSGCKAYDKFHPIAVEVKSVLRNNTRRLVKRPLNQMQLHCSAKTKYLWTTFLTFSP